MVSKFNKTEVYQERTSVFFDFVHDVLRPLMVYSIIILRHRKPFSFHTNKQKYVFEKSLHIFEQKLYK